jgi:hypothetical protein
LVLTFLHPDKRKMSHLQKTSTTTATRIVQQQQQKCLAVKHAQMRTYTTLASSLASSASNPSLSSSRSSSSSFPLAKTSTLPIPTTTTTNTSSRNFASQSKSEYKLNKWEQLFGEYNEHYGVAGDKLREQIENSKSKTTRNLKEDLKQTPKSSEEGETEAEENAPKDQAEVAAFFRIFCPKLSDHADKFTSWDNLLQSNTRTLRAAGLSIKERKLLLPAIERYKARQRRQNFRHLINQLPDDELQHYNENIQQSLYNSIYSHVYSRQFRRVHNMEIEFWWRRSLEMQFLRRKWVRNQYNGLSWDDYPYTKKDFRDPKRTLAAIEKAIEDLKEQIADEAENGGVLDEHIFDLEFNNKYIQRWYGRDPKPEEIGVNPFVPDVFKRQKEIYQNMVKVVREDKKRAKLMDEDDPNREGSLSTAELAETLTPWKRNTDDMDRSRVFIEKTRPYLGAEPFESEAEQTQFNALDKRLFDMPLSERLKFRKTDEYAQLKASKLEILDKAFERSRNKHIKLWDTKVKLWKEQLKFSKRYYKDLQAQLNALDAEKNPDEQNVKRAAKVRRVMESVKENFETIVERVQNSPNFKNMSKLELEQRDQYLWKQRLQPEFEDIEFEETLDHELPSLNKVSDIDKMNVMDRSEILASKKVQLRADAVEGIVQVLTKQFGIEMDEDFVEDPDDYMKLLAEKVKRISEKLRAFRADSEYFDEVYSTRLMVEALERKVQDPNSDVLVPEKLLSLFKSASGIADASEEETDMTEEISDADDDVEFNMSLKSVGLNREVANNVFSTHPDMTYEEFEAIRNYKGPVVNTNIIASETFANRGFISNKVGSPLDSDSEDVDAPVESSSQDESDSEHTNSNSK